LTKKQWDDQSAVNDIRANKSEGATYLYNKYGGQLLGFLKKFDELSDQDAEDILQETLIRFINHIRKELPQENVKAYLFKIGKNECYRFFTDKKIHEDTSSDNNDDNISSVDIEKEISFLDCLSKALKSFEKAEKNANKCLEILTLMAEGWSLKEIAKKIGRTHGATREFFSQCRKKLKPYVQPCRNE